MKILVVDNDRSILKLVSRFLTKNQHEIMSAEDMATGLEFALSRQPELLITDYELNDGTGLQLIQSIQNKLGDSHPMRYILMSGKGEHYIRDRLEESKPVVVHHFLNKPFDLNFLLTLV